MLKKNFDTFNDIMAILFKHKINSVIPSTFLDENQLRLKFVDFSSQLCLQ